MKMQNHSKKILVISPVPSHPQNQGNRIRIYNMLSYLKKLGCHITFVYFMQPLVDAIPDKRYIEEMKRCWDKFYTISLDRGQPAFKDRKIVKFAEAFIQKRFPWLYYRLKAAFFKKSNFIPLERIPDRALDSFLIKLLKKERFDAVLVEYIFISKVLNYFDNKTLKIIDTHDVFTDKHKEILKSLGSYGWISATPKEEAEALNRADVIIAIQDKEREFFSKITDKKVVTVGHLISGKIYSPNTILGKKRMLFVGSENDPNQHGIKYFINEILPKINKKFSDSSLLLAGRICNVIDDKNVIKFGELKDIDLAYDLADVVISPIYIGTGLKIKNIEALSYSKPLITTSFCAKELGKEARKCILIADKPEEWVKAVEKIFLSKKFAEKMSRNAYEFMKKYNDKNLKTLKEAFNIS
ncbi:MAG: glycosyltransferase [Candidatus Pacearchaeota archaeon]